MSKFIEFIKTPKGLLTIGSIAFVIVAIISYNWDKMFASGVVTTRNGCICPNGTVHGTPSSGNCAKACQGLL